MSSAAPAAAEAGAGAGPPTGLRAAGLRVEAGPRVLLDEVDLEVGAGRSLAVMGPSGSGKTTLLSCLAGLERPAAGSIEVDGHELAGLSGAERARIRLRSVGLVFQFGELLPELDVGENVGLPLRLRGERAGRAVAEALEAVGLPGRRHDRPASLSGGEVQRVAIARALVGRPRLLLADEPTGALDEDLSQRICDLLVGRARAIGAALVVATHDPLVARAMDAVVRIRGGRLVPA